MAKIRSGKVSHLEFLAELRQLPARHRYTMALVRPPRAIAGSRKSILPERTGATHAYGKNRGFKGHRQIVVFLLSAPLIWAKVWMSVSPGSRKFRKSRPLYLQL